MSCSKSGSYFSIFWSLRLVFAILSIYLSSISCFLIYPGEAEADTLPVAVVISKEIRPFIEMVEGFESAIDQPVVRIFIDQNSNPFSHDLLYKGTNIENYSFVIAVGPSALSYLIRSNIQSRKDDYESTDNESALEAARNVEYKLLYAMVLNPESIIPADMQICGISLNLFSEESVSKIEEVFPSIKRIGVLFDPDNNSQWFENARVSGVFSNIETVPLYVKEQYDLNDIHKVSNVDAILFIPDKTVTSPTIISHIIKQSIARKIPVIGYNSFFYKAGAALSFTLDYRGIGEQLARKVIDITKGTPCSSSKPDYHMILNRSVVNLLNLKLGESLPSELKEDQ